MISPRAFAACGALICALAAALAAYASHAAVDVRDQHRLALSALFAFGHGLALVATTSRDSRVARLAKTGFLIGVLLFSGSLAAGALFAAPTALAPFGGSLLILAWGILAVDFLQSA